ncbi:MAG: hypothetical protein JWM11_5612 [Planctomycetaceae bacterium]|nr:hypothetical protein [Planctomycetaceae bacterium]
MLISQTTTLQDVQAYPFIDNGRETFSILVDSVLRRHQQFGPLQNQQMSVIGGDDD